MGKDYIGYDALVDHALRRVVGDVLRKVIARGLIGGHHIYITFRTDHPDVEIPDHLRERYPEELTIVLQHQFWNLAVDDEGFEVVLSFEKVQERIRVPYAALTRFADPGVKFGLQFAPDAADDDAPAAPTPLPTKPETEPAARARPSEAERKEGAGETDESDESEEGGATVVALDAFRKK